MSAQSNTKVAVVGYNISALKALCALQRVHPTIELKWLLAFKDFTNFEQNSWACLPDQILQCFNLDKTLANSLQTQWFIHFENYDHEPLSSFVHNPLRTQARRIPKPLRKKIESLSIWNDVTPRAWNENKGVDCLWTQKEPSSLPHRHSSSFHLINRKNLLQSQFPIQPDPRIRVMGIDEGETSNSYKLIYNAPYGSESFDRVLWTSHSSRIRLENKNSDFKNLTNLPLGRWRTWTARVPEKYISYLKPASIWLDSGENGKYFLNTGIFRTSTLHRVLTCSPAKAPQVYLSSTNTHESEIQIETLEFFSEPLISKTNSTYRPDSFLWDYCPFLKQLDASVWKENNIDENWIYSDPFSTLHYLSKGLDFWSGGHFSDISKLIELNALWLGLKPLEKFSEKSLSPKIDAAP